MKLFFVVAMVVCLAAACDGLNWKRGRNGGWYAQNCIFGYLDGQNLDVAKENVPQSKCYSTCLNTGGCTHYNYQDGTCWMKKGIVFQNDALDFYAGSECGIVRKHSTLGNGF